MIDRDAPGRTSGPAVEGAAAVPGRRGPGRWDALAALRAPWALVALGAILVGALVLRAWDLGQVDERAGEVLTEERARGPWGDAIRSMAEPRNQGPLYYLMLRVLPGDDVTALRIPSVVLGVLAVGLLVAFVAVVFRDRGLALWSGLLLAVSPLHVLLSRLARPYGLLVVLSLLVTAAFLALVSGRRGTWWWGGFVALSALAYLTHFTALVLPVAQALVLLVRRPGRPLWWRWSAAQALALAPLAAWVAYALGQTREPSEGSIPGPTLATVPRAVWNLLVGAGIDTGAWMTPAIVLATVGLAGGVVWGIRRRDVGAVTMLALVAAASIPTFVAVLTITTKYSDRYLAVALPAFMILVAAGWTRTGFARVGVVALAVIVASAAVVSARSTFDDREPGEDWSGAARVVGAEAGAGDLVVFQRSTTRRAFEDASPSGADPPFEVVELDATADTTADERRAEDVWVVYRNPIEDFHTGAYRDFTPLEPGLSEMSDWLIARRERIVDERVLEGMRIFRLRPEGS